MTTAATAIPAMVRPRPRAADGLEGADCWVGGGVEGVAVTARGILSVRLREHARRAGPGTAVCTSDPATRASGVVPG